MKLGTAEIYANHPIIVIGSTDPVGNPLALGGSAAVASENHVTVATRGQAGLTRVSLWKQAGPLVGEVVFDGHLILADHLIAVFDVEGLSRFSATVGVGGRQRVALLVDDPGFASRIDVIFDRGQGRRALTAVSGFPLYDVSVPAGEGLEKSDELALILSGHDSPMSRLAAAIKLIGGSEAPRPPIKSFWIRLLIEWIRWLRPTFRIAESRSLGALIEEKLFRLPADALDSTATELALEVLQQRH